MIYKKYLTILASAGLLAAASCEKSGVTETGGDEIFFSAEAEGCENVDTKATYSGVNYTESSKKYEKIYWSNGDLIRIYCEDGDTTEIHNYYVDKLGKECAGKPTCYLADYKVTGASETTAGIELNSSTTPIGLKWNEDTGKKHNFWAVFPAPSVNGATRGDGINGKTLYGNLNSEQNTLSGALTNDGNGNYTLAPDMKWMLMYGYQLDITRETDVNIKFKPLTTAIQFTITNSVAKDLFIKQINLISSTPCQLWGNYDVTNVDSPKADGFPLAAFKSGSASTANMVSLPLSSNVTIKQNKTFTFTFFIAPVADVNDLKFQIVRGGDDDGATMTTRLGYTDGTYIKFPRCKKSFVKGIMTPEGVQWTIDYAPELTDWIDDGGETLTLN